MSYVTWRNCEEAYPRCWCQPPEQQAKSTHVLHSLPRLWCSVTAAELGCRHWDGQTEGGGPEEFVLSLCSLLGANTEMEDRPCSNGNRLMLTLLHSPGNLGNDWGVDRRWTLSVFLSLLKLPQVLLSLSLICLAIYTVLFSLIWVSLHISRHPHHKFSLV